MNKLIYIAPDYFPEQKANSIHVINQVNALARIDIKVQLIYKSENGETSNEILKNVEQTPIHIRRGRHSNVSFFFALCRRYKWINNTPVLTRSRISVMLFLFSRRSKKVVFEAHEPLNKLWLRILVMSKRIPVIAISAALEKIICRETNDSGKISILHDGSDLVDFSDICSKKKHKPKVVYVGSVGRGRGIELILKLAASLGECDFHIVGNLEESFEVSVLNLTNVSFHGWKSKLEILQIVKNADVLLAPYQNDLKLDNGLNTLDYMSPLKIFEYMSFNVPMVVSDYPVIREVLDNQIDALLVEPSDIDQWISAIQSILANPDLATFLSNNALNKLESNFTWERRAEGILNIFE
jgi:glycosyltransferase involved in cell wall biosynthesis